MHFDIVHELAKGTATTLTKNSACANEAHDNGPISGTTDGTVSTRIPRRETSKHPRVLLKS